MKSIFLFLTLLVAVPMRAQDADCSINLNPVIALLEQAQELSEAGSSIEATQLVANARADLERIEASCATNPSDDIDLDDPVTVESSVGTFTFNPPVGWIIGDLEDDFQVLGNSERVLELDMSSPTPPTPEAGDIFGGIGLVTAESLFVGEAGADASPLALLQALGEEGITSLGEEWVEPVAFTIDDRDAAVASVIADDYVLSMMVIDAGFTEDDIRLYGIAIFLTAPNNDANWQPTAEAILGSVTLE